jgi:hypothetical protein
MKPVFDGDRRRRLSAWFKNGEGRISSLPSDQRRAA